MSTRAYRGTVYREKRIRVRKSGPCSRYVGVVMDHADALRIQTVQLVFGVWVRQTRARVSTIERKEFAQRFEPA